MPMYIIYGILFCLALILVILFVKIFTTKGWMEKDEESKQYEEEMLELSDLEKYGVEFIQKEEKGDNKNDSFIRF